MSGFLSKDLKRATKAIAAARPTWLVASYGEIDSTNSEARRRIESGAATTPMVMLADHQTAGRGQQGRTWEDARAKSFLGTIAWQPRSDAAPALWPMRIGVAVAEALELLSNCGVECKWPNDLLIEGGKVAGVLVETAGNGWLIAGVGVNLLQSREELPPRAAGVPHATSLAHEFGGSAPPRDAAIVAIAAALIASTDDPLPAPLLIGAVRKRWKGAGKACRVRTPSGFQDGTLREIADDGRMIVETAGGLVAAMSPTDLQPPVD